MIEFPRFSPTFASDGHQMDTKFDNITEVAGVRELFFGGLQKSTLNASYQGNRAVRTGDLRIENVRKSSTHAIIGLHPGSRSNIALR